MNHKLSILVCIVLFLGFSAKAQDEIWLLNGDKKQVKNLEFSEDKLSVRFQNDKGKTKYISTSELFSVTLQGQDEFVYFKPTNEMSLENMKEYMYGETDAKEYSAKDVFFANFFLGVKAPFDHQRLGILIPVGASFVFGQTTPPLSALTITDKSEHYIKGYKQVVKRKRLVNALLGGSAGLLVGFTTAYFINN